MRPISLFARGSQAFTLIELLLVLSLLSILALAIVPTLHLADQRTKERALQQNLKILRTGIDDFKLAWEREEIPKSLSLAGYPSTLSVLYEGVQLPTGERRRFLKIMPRDPFFPDAYTPSEKTWALKGDQTGRSPPQTQEGIWDVHSTSPQIGLNGVPYAEW